MGYLTKSDRRECVKQAIKKLEEATEVDVPNRSKGYVDTTHFSFMLIKDAINYLREFLKIYGN